MPQQPDYVAAHPRAIDIGHGVYIRFTMHGGAEKAGLIESHPGSDQHVRCFGAITFDLPETADLPGPKWKVESLDPLTLSPSLQCKRCKHHGYIRGGKWVSA